jgi:alpha-tubulin suppressor-like RCC1 family protein
MIRSAFALALAFVAAGCFSPSYPSDGSFPCGSNGECPADFECSPFDQRCWPTGGGPQIVDECSLGTDSCNENATCTDSVAAPGFSCACNSGFTGNGTDCTDIDECSNGSSECDESISDCSNTPGSYSCACKLGFTGTAPDCRPEYDVISTGGGTTCAVREDGTLWCWGELMRDALQLSGPPLQIGTDIGWTDVAVGSLHVCAVRSGGLYCFGKNNSGQLGQEDLTLFTRQPTRVESDNDWAKVAAGGAHTCALRQSGAMWCFGANSDGQLGLGVDSGPNVLAPRAVTGSITFTQLSAGAFHTCAVDTANQGYCWGANSVGQIGFDTGGAPLGSPSQLTGDWIEVSAAEFSSCGVQQSGQLFCWGINGSGELGVGDNTNRVSPTRVGTATNWEHVDAMPRHSCGIRGGQLFCWGENNRGQLGSGSQASSNTPTSVAGGGTWLAVTGGNERTCGLKADGAAWCWGANGRGDLGDGQPGQKLTPFRSDDDSWEAIAGGANHACGIDTDGAMWCWGINLFGTVGDGSRFDRQSPAFLGTPNNWTITTAGFDHSCGLRSTSEAYCWGSNALGQLGLGAGTGDADEPTQVGGAEWLSIAAGQLHTCAIKTSGNLFCWGNNGNFQSGPGGGQVYLPQQVDGASDWKSLALGDFHSCGIKGNGFILCWGTNGDGQLGQGTTTGSSSAPLLINSGFSDWKSISAAGNTTCAIRGTGLLYCWGSNFFGQIGNGSGAAIFSDPTPVLDAVVNWKSVAVGFSHVCATRTDGSLWCWGFNSSGQLGYGALDVPQNMADAGRVGTDIDWDIAYQTRGAFSCATKNDGSRWCWGTNDVGELGDGSAWHNEPVNVRNP